MIQIDPDYVPEELERKQVFGVVFEQGHNNLKIDKEMLKNIVTENKDLTEEAAMDLVISLITLKYTQSNSVCFVKGGQAIGIGAGQQSRVHCTRLAGSKADNWYLRQNPKVLNLPLLTASAEQTVTMPLTYTLVKIIWMFWLTEDGRRSLRKNRKYLQEKKREHG